MKNDHSNFVFFLTWACNQWTTVQAPDYRSWWRETFCSSGGTQTAVFRYVHKKNGTFLAVSGSIELFFKKKNKKKNALQDVEGRMNDLYVGGF